MSAPDALVLFRALAGIPVFLAIGYEGRGLAFAIFAAAGLSDAIDGWLARRGRAADGRGIIFDPLADKILVLVTLGALALVGAAPLWLAAPIALRELVVGVLRVLAYRSGDRSRASAAAKLKTACEMCGLGLLIAARPPDVAALAGVALLAAALVIGVATLPLYIPYTRRRPTLG